MIEMSVNFNLIYQKLPYFNKYAVIQVAEDIIHYIYFPYATNTTIFNKPKN